MGTGSGFWGEMGLLVAMVAFRSRDHSGAMRLCASQENPQSDSGNWAPATTAPGKRPVKDLVDLGGGRGAEFKVYEPGI